MLYVPLVVDVVMCLRTRFWMWRSVFSLLCLTVFISPTCLCSLHLLNFLSSYSNKVKHALDLNTSPWRHTGAGDNAPWILQLSNKVNSQLHGLTTLLHFSAYKTHWTGGWVDQRKSYPSVILSIKSLLNPMLIIRYMK